MRFNIYFLTAILFIAGCVTHCGSSTDDSAEGAALALAALVSQTAAPCPSGGTCYDFSSATGFTSDSGLFLSGGVIAGSGNLVLTAPSAFNETRYQVTFSLPAGGSLKMWYGNPSGGTSSTYFDRTAEGNAFLLQTAAAGQALDKAGVSDTLPTALTPSANTSTTYCLETHEDGAAVALHMLAWTSCLSTGTSSSTYDSENTSKGGTALRTANNGPVSGKIIGFQFVGATLDRVVVQQKP